MIHLDKLENQVNKVQIQDSPALADLRRLLLEIEEAINSPDFTQLALEERGKLQSSEDIERWRRVRGGIHARADYNCRSRSVPPAPT